MSRRISQKGKTIVKKYFYLLRIRHYIKNLLLFIPLFFGGQFLRAESMISVLKGFLAFSFTSSAVYIVNDLCDYSNDKKHNTKKNRPIANGQISKFSSSIVLFCCLAIVVLISFSIGNFSAAMILASYLIVNLGYSFGLKKIPIFDIFILASGFVLRIYYGACLSNTEVSKWLFLVVITGSLYMGLGKRRNELRQGEGTRHVLKYYNDAFLDKNMYVQFALSIVFYALWAIDFPNQYVSWSIPVFILIMMCYSLSAERNVDGDPVEIILHNKPLIILLVLYCAFIFSLLYLI